MTNIQRTRILGLAALVWFLALALPPKSLAQAQGPVRITLDEAIQMALTHNHTLLAACTTILDSQAQEITAAIRPNPVIAADYQFIPAFSPSYFNEPASQVPLPEEFDVNASNTFELGRKRHWRIIAASDQTAVTQSTVTDNERTLTFQTASQFITVQLAESTLDLAQQV
jgi:outer membrane protein, heavy metal efflux system